MGRMLDRPEIRIANGDAMLVTHVDEADRPTRQYRFTAEVEAAGRELSGLDTEDWAILFTLLNREWEWDLNDSEKPAVITPEIRRHLDRIERLVGKVAKMRG